MIVDDILQIDPIYDLVKILNDNGHQILRIEDEFFILTEFIAADKNTPYHKVLGKHITKLLVDHYRVAMQQFQTVQVKIEALPERDIQFSGDSPWIQYIK